MRMKDFSLEITSSEFEEQVAAWLKEAGSDCTRFSVSHQERVQGKSGSYKLDVFAEFECLAGATIQVLVECKMHKSKVKRDTVQNVHAKLQDIGANKAMIFALSGFQAGAIEYAKKNGIALIKFSDGRASYVTRSLDEFSVSSFPSDLPKYVGFFSTRIERGLRTSVISEGHTGPILDWITAS